MARPPQGQPYSPEAVLSLTPLTRLECVQCLTHTTATEAQLRKFRTGRCGECNGTLRRAPKLKKQEGHILVDDNVTARSLHSRGLK